MKFLVFSLLAFQLSSQTFLTCNPHCGLITLENDVEYVPHSRKIRAKKKAVTPKMAIHTPTTAAELQTALTNSVGGDEIHLTAGTTYTGNFTLPSGKSSVVTIRTASVAWSTEGTRVSPSNLSSMAIIKGDTDSPVFNLGANSDNWKFLGIAIAASSSAHSYSLIQIGDLDNATTLAELPDNVTVERCYIYGDSTLGGRRGILAMGSNITVKDSYIENFFGTVTDPQAILISEGAGPTLIENNYLEGSGENLYISHEAQNLAAFPENITIRRNHIKKRLAWQPPATNYIIKNLFEIKGGRNILFEGNVLENNWVSAQSGYAIVLTVRNHHSEGSAEISGVTIRNNRIINSASGINVLGKDDNSSNIGQMFNILIDNNIIEGTVNRAFQFLNGIQSITVTNNTALSVTSSIWHSDQLMSGSIVFTNNAIGRGSFGIHNSGIAEGLPSIVHFWTSWTVTGNVFFPSTGATYPAGNLFVADASQVPPGYGANITAINSAIAGATVPSLPPIPPATTPGPTNPPVASVQQNEIVAKVSANLNDFGYFYKAEDFSDSLQDAYDEVISITGCYPKATTIAATANKTYYNLPALITDFVALRGIYNHRIKRWLIPKSMRWLDAQRDDWEIQSGEPEYFVPVNYKYVAIYPRVSVTSGNFWVFYYAAADTLTASGTPNLPSISGDEAIEAYVTADLFEQAEEWVKAQEYYSEYLRALGEVDKFRNTLRLPDYVDGLR